MNSPEITIPDEAIEAALRGFHPNDWTATAQVPAMHRALAAALPYLSPDRRAFDAMQEALENAASLVRAHTGADDSIANAALDDAEAALALARSTKAERRAAPASPDAEMLEALREAHSFIADLVHCATAFPPNGSSEVLSIIDAALRKAGAARQGGPEHG